MDLVIRKISKAEIQEYRELRLCGLRDHPEAFGESADAFSERSLADIEEKLHHSEQKNGFILGGFIDGKMVGIVGLGRETGAKSEHRASLWGMYVLPPCRGTGIGRRLIEELIAEAKRIPGLKQVHLAVTIGNDSAFKLYQRLGFKIYGTDPRALRIDSKYYDEYLLALIFDSH
jgi:ribosomal protein S18 acetylase RimI-like enzyme